MKTPLKLLPFLLLATPAAASNFSYSQLSVDLGTASLDDDFFILGEEYDDLGYASFGGGYQFNDFAAFSLTSSAYAAEEGDTEFTYSWVELYLHFPIAVADNIDIAPFIGPRNDDAEICAGSLCASDDESSIGYGLEIRAWLVPDSLEFNASYTDADEDGFDSEVEIGVAAFLDNNSSIQIDYMSEDSINRFSIGYRYTWK